MPNVDPTELFGVKIIDAMNDIAELILVSRSIHDIRARFRNDIEIDYQLARPRANRIGNAARDIAQLLLTAVQRGTTQEDIDSRIGEIRTSKLELIHGAVHDAELLARQESDANDQVNISKSGVVPLRILAPLEHLAAKWT